MSWYLWVFKYKFLSLSAISHCIVKSPKFRFLLHLIIWYYTTFCLLLTCQIVFCSHIFCVCLLDIENSGWCKNISAFDSANVIKENTKEQPHVLAIQASVQLLCQTNIGRNVGCMLQVRLTGIKGEHHWQGTTCLCQMRERRKWLKQSKWMGSCENLCFTF